MVHRDYKTWKRGAWQRVYLLSLTFAVGFEPGCADVESQDGSSSLAAADASGADTADGRTHDDAAVEARDPARDAGNGLTDDARAADPRDVGVDASAVDGQLGSVQATADYLFPDESLVDWVSYAEQVAVVTVLSEERIPPPPEVEQRGEGYIGRRVALRVDETIWLNDGAPLVPEIFEMVVFGWILRERSLFVATSREVPRMYPGGRYIVPLLTMSTGAIAPLTSRSVIAHPSSGIAVDDVAKHGQSAVARSLSNTSADELRRILSMTLRDPAAVQFWDLPPDERVRAVSAGTN